MKSNRVAFIALAVFILIPISCKFGDTSPPWDGNLGGGGVEENTLLFVTTDIPGEIRFETNDEQYSKPYGKSFWYPVTDEADPFTSWSVTLAKEGGREEAGFGLILCHGEDATWGESMLTVMIRTDGYYQAAEVIGTDYQPFDVWTHHDAIHEGYGFWNTLSVSRDVGGIFTLSINGVAVSTFQDDDEPYHSGGVQGYLVVTSPLEDFPDQPVIVIFNEEP